MPGLRRPRHAGTRIAGVLAVAALLAVHYALALTATRHKSQTFDETAHITAGFAYWSFDDYRLQPENGNLPQRLAALPLVLAGDLTFPSRDQPAWRGSDVWEIGDQFLHRTGNDLDAMLRRSRAVMALLGVALCLTVFLWARRLHGFAGGVAALVLCAFSPLVLANGPLATSDTCAALFFLLSLGSLWALFHRISPGRVLACAAALAGLALSKTSAVLILPLAALLAAAALALRRELVVALPGRAPRTLGTVPRRLAAMLGAVLLCLLVVWAAIWAAYGCRFLPAPPREQAGFEHYFWPNVQAPDLAGVSSLAGTPGKLAALAGRHRLLPESFLYGTAYVFAALERYSFLNGEYSTGGWRRFFPYCFLVKSTLPLLALLLTALAAAAVAALRPATAHPLDPAAPQRKRRIPESAPLWILLAVFVPTLIASTINLGARHLLPLYPPLCILLGGLARWRPRGLRWWAVLLLCWHVAEGVRGYPDYLAYFNQITGRRQAYRHLVDSSLDWGQDLPGYRAWLDRRRARAPGARAYFSYFGTGSPAYHGIDAEPIDLEQRERHGLPPLGAGSYCVSATELQAVYYPVRGRWNSRFEGAYQALRAGGGRAEGLDPGLLAWMGATFGQAEPRVHLARLATARLYAFLRGREPDDEIGYSILCYDLGEDDLRAALQGPPPEPPAPGAPGG